MYTLRTMIIMIFRIHNDLSALESCALYECQCDVIITIIWLWLFDITFQLNFHPLEVVYLYATQQQHYW